MVMGQNVGLTVSGWWEGGYRRTYSLSGFVFEESDMVMSVIVVVAMICDLESIIANT